MYTHTHMRAFGAWLDVFLDVCPVSAENRFTYTRACVSAARVVAYKRRFAYAYLFRSFVSRARVKSNAPPM